MWNQKEYLRNNPNKVKEWNARSRKWRKARLEECKKNPCTDCGRSFPPECMDFDHKPGEEKLFAVCTANTNLSWEKQLAEMAKCDLVCACCHRLRTTKRLRDKCLMQTNL